ncbi:MAG: hypothetical protein WC007_02050 [Pelobacteraceae bacterium]
MNFKKTATIVAAVAAMAATSVPAMAMENEFHGMYRLRAMVSNYENAGGGVLAKDAPAMTVFEQRARLQYTAKASGDLKLVTQFEVDSSWGDTAYNNGRGMGGAMAADTVNLETKHVYLDFNCPITGANFKVGIQPQSDAYKGIFFNDDLAGIFASKKFGGVTTTAGFSRLQDFNRTSNSATVPFETANPVGKSTLDLFLLDAKLAVSKDLTVGGAYYYINNNPIGISRNDAMGLHVVGANAAAKFGMISADAFVAYQGGSELTGPYRDLSAFAGQVAVKANLDKAGNVSANVLYTSGGKATDSKAKAWQSLNSGDTLAVSSNTYYDSKMVLLMRNIVAMDSDKALVQTINNGNRGVTLLAVGYNTNLTDKLGASANVGYAMASQKQATDKSESLGTEINAQIDYKMFANLTTSLTGAYVVLGDGLKYASNTSTVKRDNPYLASVMFNYVF